MRKKIFLILSIIVLMIVVVIITIVDTNSDEINFNTNLAISTDKTRITAKIKSFSNKEYAIDEISIAALTNEEEQQIIKTAYDITNAFNNIESENYVYEVEKYAIRPPSEMLDESMNSEEEYNEWNDNILTVEVMAWLLQKHSYHFSNIEDVKITYASTERSIVQVYINDFTGQIGVTKVGVDAIFEYEIIYEESSEMYKVNKLAVEWIKDLEEYYQKNDTVERYLNNTANNTLSNVTSYLPTGFTNFDYSKLEKVTAFTTSSIATKNKDSVVIIDSASEGGMPAGSASGFFVRSGIVVTSYSSVYNMIKNNAARYYVVDCNDKVHEIEGIVAAYPELNIIILKLKEEIGTPVIIGESNNLEKNDPILVISSSLGLKSSIKLGIYFDTLDDDYKIIRTSLPLIDGDSGSAIFNLNGEVIAINTSVSNSDSEYNSGLNNATDINILKEVVNKIQKKSFKDIESVNFNKFNEEEKIQVINNVKDKIWKNYEQLPQITKTTPLNLYSAYTNDKYLIIRYKQNQYSILTNQDVLNLYIKNLTNHSYNKISENVYEKDGITIRMQNNLGYIIIIVEGVI